MTELQNTLKEIDLQIIYRRLEARKRNITRDGGMSKRQIATAYRGYYGLENQYHALTHMSNQTMMHTKLKNDHIHARHVDDMRYLIEQEKHTKERTDKTLKVLRDDVTAQLAYQYVYKTHSFKRYYKSQQQQQKKPRPASDKPEMYDLERMASAKGNAPRPLGSLREIEKYKDELKLKFPPIQNQDHAHDVKSPRVNALEGKTYENLKEENKEHQGASLTAFPNIEHAMGVEVKVKYKIPDDDRHSVITAPPAGFTAESDDESCLNPNLVPLDMGQTLMLMRKKEKERQEQRRQLPATPKAKQRAERKESWNRVLPETPQRRSPVYPDDTKLKKLMRREVTDVMDTWARRSKRLETVDLAKDHHKTTLAENPIPTFDRSRPTSAILRDFKEYKKVQSEQETLRLERENSHAMIVRKLSPQPRVGSPVAQTRNDFMTASRALQRENSHVSINNAGKLRRTDSEKFPSVSRTSSYKDVLENTSDLHENALLTAAERIELEKQKRHEANNDRTKNESKKQTKPSTKSGRRKLPALPTTKPDTAMETTSKTSVRKTSVFTISNDNATINKVKLANLAHDDQHTNAAAEVNFVKPDDQQKQTKIQTGRKITYIDSFETIPVDRVKMIKDVASAACGNDFWPKLNKTINFNYESYSRTSPETKRRMELRAKNRRKIQQKNAQLKEEMKSKKKGKQSEGSSVSERPPTRVSFNENVMVFQKI